MSASPEILSMMGQYPVIKLSLKSAKQPNFNEAGIKLRDEIIFEFSRHSYLLESKKLSDLEKMNISRRLKSGMTDICLVIKKSIIHGVL